MLSVFVRVSMKSPVTGTAALYYDVGRQFNATHVSTSTVYGDGNFHNVNLIIPFNETFYNLRFDPPSVSDGEIIINKIDIINCYGSVLHDFNPVSYTHLTLPTNREV